MSIQHNNPTRPRFDQKSRQDVWARAPYNFIPLPERVVTVQPPPPQDEYSNLTGWIDCEMETLSPVYMRGMLSEAQLKELAAQKEQEGDSKKRLTPEQKEQKDAVDRKNKEDQSPFFNIAGIPFIPGSSLRGMIRSLVEIISYGKMRWVSSEPTFSFRAVAAQNDDPLREAYREIIGPFGKNVKAGYLKKRGDDWFIQPAKIPSDLGLSDQGAYLKVKERDIDSTNIKGYLNFNSPDYHPQFYNISFSAQVGQGKRGKYTRVQVGDVSAGYPYRGVMVCSGNMLETSGKGQRSPRKNHALVLEAMPNVELPINPQAIRDYLISLTPFQKELYPSLDGCLKDGAPVFFVQPPGAKEVYYFGHNPNFRVPVRLPGMEHASTPLDFVPQELRADEQIDFADALFGWTPEAGGTRKTSCAGRVFFNDAHLVSLDQNIWLNPNSITPHTLAGPKATSFQHYLVQSRENGHAPDDKHSLAHYGKPRNETQIRGYKMYWHKGRSPQLEANDKEKEHESQLTRIRPIKPGVRFAFRVRFESLTAEELGALMWALKPRGQADTLYAHKVGMGKPLGMGAVKIENIKIHLTDRAKKRYTHLFDGTGWETGETETNEEDYRLPFEKAILKQLEGIAPQAVNLTDLGRINELLTMLKWYGDTPTESWLEWTRYMEIEHGDGKVNEYKERPVLPLPSAVAKQIDDNQTKPIRKPDIANDSKKATEDATKPKWPLQRGMLLWGKVNYIERNGDVAVDLELPPGSPDAEIIGMIYHDQLSGHRYKEGERIRFEVLETIEEKSDWLVKGKPGIKNVNSSSEKIENASTPSVFKPGDLYSGIILDIDLENNVFLAVSGSNALEYSEFVKKIISAGEEILCVVSSTRNVATKMKKGETHLLKILSVHKNAGGWYLKCDFADSAQ